MIKSLILIFFNVLIGATGQLMLKSGMIQVGRIGAVEMSRPLATLGAVFTNPLILLALPLYAGALIMWLIVLSRLQLSFAYPFLALNYVINALLAQAILGEHIPLLRWVAIGLIFSGVVLITAPHDKLGLPGCICPDFIFKSQRAGTFATLPDSGLTARMDRQAKRALRPPLTENLGYSL